MWNAQHEVDLRRNGHRGVTAIGAPFLYLIESQPTEVVNAKRAGTLVFLPHSAEQHRVRHEYPDFIEFVESETPPPYVASVFFQDLRPELLRFLADRGWKSICFGRRSDPTFLLRLRDQASLRECAVGEHMQTGLLYAGMMGCLIRTLGVNRSARLARERYDDHRDIAQWESEFGTEFSKDSAMEVAGRELGVSLLKPVNALKRALGWSSSIKTAYAGVVGKALDLYHGDEQRMGGDWPRTVPSSVIAGLLGEANSGHWT